MDKMGWIRINKLKILIVFACRSDTALTKPLIDLFSKQDWVECWSLELEAANFVRSYELTQSFLKTHGVDLVLICGDRSEMLASATAAFHCNIRIVHYGSGITNTIATYDDISRHNIALMANLCLCEDRKSAFTTFNLRQTIGKIDPNHCNCGCRHDENNIHVVENLYLEGLETIDESLVPEEPYDLVLINPETLNKSTIEIYNKADLITKEYYRKSIWVPNNPDQYEKLIGKINFDYDNVPRPQFLGLMKHCERFITNSSAAYYEAPAFLRPEQIILVGERNKGRSTPTEWKQDYKTSDRILEIIKEWWAKNE